MNTRPDLLPIGTFASMTRLSIKALRLYDRLAILQAHHIDSQSGYRYYGVHQLAGARMIRSMRDMDMPLATIRQVLAALATSPAQAESLVREYLRMRAKQVEQIRRQGQQFIQLLQQEAKPMSLEVNVKKITPQQVISITRRVKVGKLGDTITQTLAALLALIKEQGARVDGESFGIYHGSINEQDDGPIEICVPVNGEITARGEAAVKQLKGGEAARVTMLGAQCDFPAILKGYDAVVDWIQRNGYEMAESPREIWYNAPGDEAKMEVVWLFT